MPYYRCLLYQYTYTYMFRVYINPKAERVLVTSLKIDDRSWVLISKHPTWERAYRKAVYLANRLDYVLEWFLEEQILEIYKN